MALQSRTITVGADKDSNNGGKNYVSGQVIYIKDKLGVLAPIFRDIDGLDPIPQNTISNVTNAKGQFTFFIEEGNYIAEYANQSTALFVFGADYFNNQIDFVTAQVLAETQAAVDAFNQESAEALAEFDLTLDQYKESRGFNAKGTFAAGFTYELPNDVGLDASGNPWALIDTSSLPVAVTAGTTPTNPPYKQVAYGTAAQVSTNTSDTVQSFADSFALKVFQSPTDGLTEINTRTLIGGEVYEVRKVSDDSLATIYTDKEGLNPIAQNGTSNVSGSDGVVEFYVADGDYYVEVGSVKSYFYTVQKSNFKNFAALSNIKTASEGDTYYSGLTRWICSTDGRLDVGGGLFLEPVGSIYVDDFGVVPDIDSTAEFTAMELNLLDGDTIVFGKGVYKGVYRTLKAISITTLKGAKLSNSTVSDGILQIGDSSFDSYNVVESELNYLDKTFTVNDASPLSVGDIGHLWDSSLRPSDSQPVNFQCVKIKDITGNVIEIEDVIETSFKTGQIIFYHTQNQIKNVTVTDFNAEPDDTHIEFAVRVNACEGVKFINPRTSNTVGNAISARYCYDVSTTGARIEKPRLTGSGQGYGVAYLACYLAKAKNLRGYGTRHILNADSTYNFEYEDMQDTDDKISAVSFAHNGFGGNGIVSNVKTNSAQHSVISSAQGFGVGASNAKKVDHPLRNVKIENVKTTYVSAVAADDNVAAVYLQHNLDNTHVDGVDVSFINPSDLTSSAQSSIVRVNGIATGDASFKNLVADKVGRFVFSNGDRDGASYGDTITEISRLNAKQVNDPILMLGQWAIDVDVLSFESMLGSEIIQLSETGSDDPVFMSVGSKINYSGTVKQIYSTSLAELNGSVQQIGRLTEARLLVSDGDSVSSADIQNRGEYLRIHGDVGAGTTTLGGFGRPYINGQKITVNGWISGRNDLIIPTEFNSVPLPVSETITFDSASPTKTLVVINGEWREA